MEINKKEVLNIFKHNFNFEFVETVFGTAIKMTSYKAFIFSVVTGAGYFDNPIYPFTPKGLMKLFYNAFDYKFVTGIFENTTLKNTPYILSQAKPFLFDTNFKFIVPIEFQSEIELQKALSFQFEKIQNPTDYIILRIEKSKKGNGMENFMEYLAGEYFIKQGFIVENQIPLAHSIGSPDFGGYLINEIIEDVKPFLPNGFHIIELAMLRLKKESQNINIQNRENKNIVGEAKTGTTQMTKQLLKYIDTNLFDFGFEIHPFKQKANKDYFGILTLNENFEIIFKEPKSKYISKQKLSKENYHNWLCNYMKFYILSNLTNDELNQYYQEKNNQKISNQNDLIRFVNQITTKELITKVKTLL